MRSRWIAILLAAFFGCGAKAITPVTVPVDAKSVGIIAALGDPTYSAFGGLSSFAQEKIVIENWDLNRIAIGAASSVLQARFTTEAVTGAFALPESVESDKVGELLRAQLTEHTHKDLYLVIWPGVEAIAPGARMIRFGNRGVGVTKYKDPFVTNPPFIHTTLMIGLVDGAEFNVISAQRLRGAPDVSLPWDSRGPKNRLPLAQLQDFEWKEHWADLTEQQHIVIKERLEQLLARSIAFTLGEMRLGE